MFKRPRNLRWGQAFSDFDHDGVPELLECMGNTFFEHEVVGFGLGPSRDRCLLFHRDNFSVPFELVPALEGLAVVTGGRGVIPFDYDGDGDLDVVVGASLGAPLLLENVRPSRGHWLEVSLAGRGKNPRGIGARVIVHANGRAMPALIHAGESFLSSGPSVARFGVGAALTVDVEVRWPSGSVTHERAVAVDRKLQLVEPVK